MGMPKGHAVRNSAGQIVSTQGLTEMQQNFINSYLVNGGDHVAAAREAGYSHPAESGWRLVRQVSVQTAIRKEQILKLGGRLASLAFKELESILTDTRNDSKFKRLKLDAAKTVLDRAGHIAPKDAGEALRNKELTDMSAQELEEFIRRGREAQANADKPMIDGTCSPVGESEHGQVIDNEG